MKRDVIISKSREMQNVTRRSGRARTELRKRIVRDVVNKADVKRRVGAIRFRIGSDRFEADELSVATQSPAKAENNRRSSAGRVVLGLGYLTQVTDSGAVESCDKDF